MSQEEWRLQQHQQTIYQTLRARMKVVFTPFQQFTLLWLMTPLMNLWRWMLESPPSEDMRHDPHFILEIFVPTVPDVPPTRHILPISVLNSNWFDSTCTANELSLSREGSVQSCWNNRRFCMHISSSDECISLDKMYRNSLKIKCKRIKKSRKQKFSQDMSESVSTGDESAM
ncbi:OLC1v1035413C1 [Oldenlandia corymbosa var. corymbosa]|uniref:OLC1v1035413C1 n=1 Tax=Oldenlandia corymbosa var. corymbosa TaxID=529605 RepID=A0AAV1CTF9_OLDCO|nr:OLC1v1035413C1 [Oldenlandia corymbosa var. corymbosa]